MTESDLKNLEDIYAAIEAETDDGESSEHGHSPGAPHSIESSGIYAVSDVAPSAGLSTTTSIGPSASTSPTFAPCSGSGESRRTLSESSFELVDPSRDGSESSSYEDDPSMPDAETLYLQPTSNTTVRQSLASDTLSQWSQHSEPVSLGTEEGYLDESTQEVRDKESGMTLSQADVAEGISDSNIPKSSEQVKPLNLTKRDIESHDDAAVPSYSSADKTEDNIKESILKESAGYDISQKRREPEGLETVLAEVHEGQEPEYGATSDFEGSSDGGIRESKINSGHGRSGESEEPEPENLGVEVSEVKEANTAEQYGSIETSAVHNGVDTDVEKPNTGAKKTDVEATKASEISSVNDETDPTEETDVTEKSEVEENSDAKENSEVEEMPNTSDKHATIDKTTEERPAADEDKIGQVTEAIITPQDNDSTETSEKPEEAAENSSDLPNTVSDIDSNADEVHNEPLVSENSDTSELHHEPILAQESENPKTSSQVKSSEKYEVTESTVDSDQQSSIDSHKVRQEHDRKEESELPQKVETPVVESSRWSQDVVEGTVEDKDTEKPQNLHSRDSHKSPENRAEIDRHDTSSEQKQPEEPVQNEYENEGSSQKSDSPAGISNPSAKASETPATESNASNVTRSGDDDAASTTHDEERQLKPKSKSEPQGIDADVPDLKSSKEYEPSVTDQDTTGARQEMHDSASLNPPSNRTREDSITDTARDIVAPLNETKPVEPLSEPQRTSNEVTPTPSSAPDDTQTVYLFVSMASGERGTMKNYNRATNILNSYGINFVPIEITLDERAKRLWKYKGLAKGKKLPAVFRDGDLKLDFEGLIEANEYEEVEDVIFEDF